MSAPADCVTSKTQSSSPMSIDEIAALVQADRRLASGGQRHRARRHPVTHWGDRYTLRLRTRV
jgi:hypothetical protein